MPKAAARRPQPSLLQPAPTMQFIATPEQQIIGQYFLKGENLCINAFAGTGKTATLVYLAHLGDGPGEMWCFNKRNAKAKELAELKSVISDSWEIDFSPLAPSVQTFWKVVCRII